MPRWVYTIVTTNELSSSARRTCDPTKQHTTHKLKIPHAAIKHNKALKFDSSLSNPLSLVGTRSFKVSTAKMQKLLPVVCNYCSSGDWLPLSWRETLPPRGVLRCAHEGRVSWSDPLTSLPPILRRHAICSLFIDRRLSCFDSWSYLRSSTRCFSVRSLHTTHAHPLDFNLIPNICQ